VGEPEKAKSLDISVVIPVWNEERSLGELYEILVKELEALGKSFELIFVNDGSEDNSGKILLGLNSRDSRVKVAEFSRNFGKSSALSCGFDLAQGEVIITIDADLQDDPREIPRLLEKLEQGFDMVSGWKIHRKDSLGKRLLSRIFNLTVRMVSGVKLHDFNSGFKAIRRSALEGVRLYGDLHRYLPVMIAFRGFKVTEIGVSHHPRKFGKSKYGFERIPRGFFDLLTIIFISYYSYRPLHLFGGIGILFGILGFGSLSYLTVLWFLGERPIGTRPLFIGGVMLVLVGVQLLSLGLIGELLLKLNVRQEKPYIVRRLIK